MHLLSHSVLIRRLSQQRQAVHVSFRYEVRSVLSSYQALLQSDHQVLQSGADLLPCLRFSVLSVPAGQSVTVLRPSLSPLRYPLHSPVKSVHFLLQVHLQPQEALCSSPSFQALPPHGMRSLQVFQASACMSPFYCSFHQPAVKYLYQFPFRNASAFLQSCQRLCREYTTYLFFFLYYISISLYLFHVLTC